MAEQRTARVHFISGEVRIVPVKHVRPVGEEGAREAVAIVDGKEIPIYNRVEWGFLWEEQLTDEQAEEFLNGTKTQDKEPEATIWASSTDLKGTKHERKVYFVLIRDGDKEHNLVITIQPDQGVTADRYVTPDYNYTIHDHCDHEHDACVLDDPDFEENWYGPQPGTVYQEVRKEYLPKEQTKEQME